jgi:hypothetical protein
MPACNFLFISVDAAQEKEKSAAAGWCFKVCSPYNKAKKHKHVGKYHLQVNFLY